MHRFPSLLLLLLLLSTVPAGAAVEIAVSGKPPVTIREVYLRKGVAYLPVDEVLAAVGLSGEWSSVEHLYRVKSPNGTAVISPASPVVRFGNGSQRLPGLPLFMDYRLRVPEAFVESVLPRLLDEEIVYRNLDPVATVSAQPEESPLDRLFSLLLRKKRDIRTEPAFGAILLDPGHGGNDPGVIGAGGTTEKAVTLSVSRRLEKLLKMRLDIPVHVSRDGDYTVPLQERVAAVGRADIDALLLLHAQSSLSPAVRGVALIIRPREEGQSGAPEAGEGDSIRFARQLSESLRQAGWPVNGIIRAPLLPLGRGNLPTVLVELGYLSNEEDRLLLRDEAGQERLAEALYAGIRNFIETERKEQAHAE